MAASYQTKISNPTFDKINEGNEPCVDLASASKAKIDSRNALMLDSGIDTDHDQIESSVEFQKQSFFDSSWQYSQETIKVSSSETVSPEKVHEEKNIHQECKEITTAQFVQDTQEDIQLKGVHNQVADTSELATDKTQLQIETLNPTKVDNTMRNINEDQDQRAIDTIPNIQSETATDEIQIHTETTTDFKRSIQPEDHVTIDTAQRIQPESVKLQHVTEGRITQHEEVIDTTQYVKPTTESIKIATDVMQHQTDTERTDDVLAKEKNPATSQHELQKEQSGEFVAIKVSPFNVETAESDTAVNGENKNEIAQHKNKNSYKTMLGKRKVQAYQAIFTDLTNEMETVHTNQSQPTSEATDPHEVQPPTSNRITPTNNFIFDCCCQSYHCSNPGLDCKVTRDNIMTPELKKGWQRGVKYLKLTICPLMRDSLRVLLLIAQLVFVVFNAIFSVATFSAGSNEAFNTFHLVLTLIATVLAIFDFMYSFWSSCRKCVNTCKQQQSNNSELCDSCQCACCKHCKTYSDVVRAILSELILVPLLICSIYETATGAPELNGEEAASNIVGLFLFLIDCLGIILFVYIGRILILIGVILNVCSTLETPPSNGEKNSAEAKYYPSNKKFIIGFQLYFLIHVFLQMIAQVFMFIAIGGKVRYDNRHLYDPANTDDRIRSSPELIYMCIAVTVLPLCGFLTFFIATNFWMMEFPIAFLIDLIKILETPNIEDLIEIKKVAKERSKTMHQFIVKLIKVDQLKNDYETLKNTAFFLKLSQPFRSPWVVIFCALYLVGQFAFIVTAATAYNETNQLVSQVLNGGGWVVFYVIAVFVGIIANLYAFAVAGLWISIVALVLIVLFLFCLIVMCAGSGSSKRSN